MTENLQSKVLDSQELLTYNRNNQSKEIDRARTDRARREATTHDIEQ
jgi:hypothetical protein